MSKKPTKAPQRPVAKPKPTKPPTGPPLSAPGLPPYARPPWCAGRLAVRCTLSYAEWAHGLGAWARIPVAEVLDQAVRRYADQLGYPPPQPPRLPSARPFLPSYQLQAEFRRSAGDR